MKIIIKKTKKTTTNNDNKNQDKNQDKYTEEILKSQYILHQTYVSTRKNYSKDVGIPFRMPGIPEDISENMIKFIICNKLQIHSTWNGRSGDLYSNDEGIQECKCFTSTGPISFTPSSNWNVIYFLDARKWLDNIFILYRINLQKTSNEWMNISVNKKQTFHDQCLQKRRPRLSWSLLFSQLEPYIEKVFEGHFDDIFINNPMIHQQVPLELNVVSNDSQLIQLPE
jgi:hypothetical protein